MWAVVGLLVVSCFSLSNAQADTIDDISLEKGQDGKLHINVNVSGQAQSVTPNEADSEGVYTLGLNGKSSDKVKATPLVMDASGKHIARLNVENGKVSVVVPGVRSDEVRVHMRSKTGGLTPLANANSTNRESTQDTTTPRVMPSSTFTVKPSQENSPNWFSDPWMTSIRTEEPATTVASNTQDNTKRVTTSKKSKWKRPKQAWKPLVKQSTSVKQASSSVPPQVSNDLAMAEPPIENELETLNAPLNLSTDANQGYTFETVETDEIKTSFIEPSFIENPLSAEAFEPLPPLEAVLAPEQAYTLYLELPWDNEAWLNERILKELDAQQKHLDASLWMLYLAIGGMCVAVCIGLAFKLNPSLAMQMQASQERLKNRLSRGGFTSHATPVETHQSERPFASWLTQDEDAPTELETHDAEEEQEEEDNSPLLDNEIHRIPEMSASLWQATEAHAMPEEYTKAPETPVFEPEAVPEPIKSSRVATLKPPTYFAFRHQQRINQNSFQKTPIQSVLKLPMQAKKPLQRNATPAPLSRLNRLHFGA